MTPLTSFCTQMAAAVPPLTEEKRIALEKQTALKKIVFTRYVSHLNFKQFAYSAGTIIATTAAGATIGSKISTWAGYTGPGTAIGAAIGFVAGCAGVGGYHYYEFKREQKADADIKRYEKNLLAPRKVAQASLSPESAATPQATISIEAAEAEGSARLPKEDDLILEDKIVALLGADGEDQLCPLTQALIQDPVVIPTCKKVFERKALETWLKKQPTCPLTRKPVTVKDMAVCPEYLSVMSKVSRLILDGKGIFPQFKKEEIEELSKFNKNWEHKAKAYEKVETNALKKLLDEGKIKLGVYASRLTLLAKCLEPKVSINSISVDI